MSVNGASVFFITFQGGLVSSIEIDDKLTFIEITVSKEDKKREVYYWLKGAVDQRDISQEEKGGRRKVKIINCKGIEEKIREHNKRMQEYLESYERGRGKIETTSIYELYRGEFKHTIQIPVKVLKRFITEEGAEKISNYVMKRLDILEAT